MSAELGNKLKEMRKAKDMSVDDVSATLRGMGYDVAGKTIFGYESGIRMPNADVFLALCQVYECKNVLETFELVQAEYDVPTDKEWSLIERYRSLDTTGQQAVDWILVHEAKRTDELTDAVRRSRVIEYPETATRTISYYQRVSAGAGEVIYEDIQPEQIRIPMDPKYRRVGYALKVSGHSMEPLYYDGDIILIEPTCTVDVGEIGIFNVDGKAYLKKRGLKELISLNKGYANIPLTSEARCMGRVVDKL